MLGAILKSEIASWPCGSTDQPPLFEFLMEYSSHNPQRQIRNQPSHSVLLLTLHLLLLLLLVPPSHLLALQHKTSGGCLILVHWPLGKGSWGGEKQVLGSDVQYGGGTGGKEYVVMWCRVIMRRMCAVQEGVDAREKDGLQAGTCA